MNQTKLKSKSDQVCLAPLENTRVTNSTVKQLDAACAAEMMKHEDSTGANATFFFSFVTVVNQNWRFWKKSVAGVFVIFANFLHFLRFLIHQKWEFHKTFLTVNYP